MLKGSITNIYIYTYIYIYIFIYRHVYTCVCTHRGREAQMKRGGLRGGGVDGRSGQAYKVLLVMLFIVRVITVFIVTC